MVRRTGSHVSTAAMRGGGSVAIWYPSEKKIVRHSPLALGAACGGAVHSLVRCSEAVVFEPQDEFPWRASKRSFWRNRDGVSCWNSCGSCTGRIGSGLLSTNGERKPCRHHRRGFNLRRGRLARRRARRAVRHHVARRHHRRVRRHCSRLRGFSTPLRNDCDARHSHARCCAPCRRAVRLTCGRRGVYARRVLSDRNAELSLAVSEMAA